MLWFVINTDLTITTEKVTGLFSTMMDGYVDYVGVCLGLPRSKVNDISSNYQSAVQRRDAYIDAYVNDHPCPQWRRVSSALRFVDLHHQADVVVKTYVQGTIYNILNCGYWSISP